eukprot:5480396-Prymnesium_polylepis.1
MADEAIARFCELRIKECNGQGGQAQIEGDRAAAFNRFQVASKGKDRCFCRANNAANACHLEVHCAMDQLKVLAPQAWGYFANKPGQVQSVQRALGIAEHPRARPVCPIPQTKIGGQSRHNVIFGFCLISTGKANIDGTAFKKIENDDGTIDYSVSAVNELDGEYEDAEYEDAEDEDAEDEDAE